MKHHKKLATLLVSCQLLATLASCTTSDNGTSDNSSTDNATNSSTTTTTTTGEAFSIDLSTLNSTADCIALLTGLDADEVVATAGDYEVTAGEALYFATSDLDMMNQYAMYGMTMPWGDVYEGITYEESTLKNAVELALVYKIIESKEEEYNFEYTEEMAQEVDDYLTSVRESYNNDERVFQYILWSTPMTEELFKFTNKSNIIYQGEGGIYDSHFSEGGTDYPEEDDILTYMEENSYYKVQHILLSTETAESEEEVASILARAEALTEELRGSSDLASDFLNTMLEQSEDPGSLMQPEGYTANPGMMVPEFEEASLLLEVGEMSDPVQSDFGYHIIYRLPLEADATVADSLLQSKELELQEEWLSEFDIAFDDVLFSFDLQSYYEGLNALRAEVDPYIMAGSSVLEEEPDETEDESEEESEETDVESEESEESEEETEEASE